jgi:hypothetical protein
VKVNPTVTLTLILLFLMIGAGITSASWGYKLGREALKGITQPDTRPINNVTDSQGKPLRREGSLALLKEKDIIANVKARVGGKDASEEADKKDPKADAKTDAKADTKASPKADPAAGFPLFAESRAVTLGVQAVRKQGTSLVLDVSLQNNSTRAVQFLYDSMEITNDQGRLLSAKTQGLPEELAPNAQQDTGTITVPMDLLDGAKSLSLSLTDYPEQQVQLRLSGIPVEK